MDKKKIREFIKKELGEKIEIIEIENDYVNLLTILDPSYDPVEIEVIMYYALDDGNLGEYTYCQIY